MNAYNCIVVDMIMRCIIILSCIESCGYEGGNHAEKIHI